MPWIDGTRLRDVPHRQRNSPLATNRLLAALPKAVRRTLLAHGERIELSPAIVLCEPGAAIQHVFFPLDSAVTLMAGTERHSDLESGLVGNEGMLGATLALGVRISAQRWLVQGAGRALRIEAGWFHDELALSPALRGTLQRYLYVTLAQLAQTAVCKRFHVVEARLARWLLMTRDRLHTEQLRFTHENLAHVLGVRRAGITRAANALRRRNLIRYYRGSLQIVNRRGLEAASCDCYAEDHATYASVMG
jgi:CRP-like cAMP-binding protein